MWSALAAVVVGVDVLFFRSHIWERLAATVGIVVVFEPPRSAIWQTTGIRPLAGPLVSSLPV